MNDDDQDDDDEDEDEDDHDDDVFWVHPFDVFHRQKRSQAATNMQRINRTSPIRTSDNDDAGDNDNHVLDDDE